MVRRLAFFILVVVGIAMVPAVAEASRSEDFTAGAAGVGDPYFPDDGNGGYDVDHYTWT